MPEQGTDPDPGAPAAAPATADARATVQEPVPATAQVDDAEFLGSLTLLRGVVDQLRDAMMLVRNGIPIYVNDAMCRLTGFARAEIVGIRPPMPYWPPEEIDKIKAAFVATGKGEFADHELILKKQDGTRFHAIVSTSSLKDAEGRTLCYSATIKDVTEHRRLEAALRASEQRWRSIAENPYDFVVILDRSYKYVYVNHTAGNVSVEDLVGKATPFDAVDSAFHATIRTAFERGFSDGQASYFEARVPSLGRWFGTIVGPIYEAGKVEMLSLLSRDITDRKRAEQALEKNEQRLRMALEGANDGVFDLDADTGDVFLSKRGYQLLRFRPDGPDAPKRLEDFDRLIHPDDRHALEGVRQALLGGAQFSAEVRLRTGNGEYRWFHGRGKPFFEPGTNVRFAGFLTDITVRKEADRRRAELELQLRESQKLEVIGMLAGGIAHDFNNLLGPILGFAEISRLKLASDHPVQENLEQIVAASLRARDLVGRITRFGRRREPNRQALDLCELVRDALRLMKASMPSSIAMSVDMPNSIQVTADVTQLHQVVANLFTNAHQAMPDGGRIAVELRQGTAAEFGVGELESGRYARLRVADTGSGMTDEVAKRAFEPFFTTKPAGEGTGLGLSVARGIVTENGGVMTFRTAPGRGTTFDVFLPVSDVARESSAPGAVPSVRPRPANGARILCVDDEPSVVQVFRRSLEEYGHEVAAMTDAVQALEWVRADPLGFDCMVTDQTMPRLSGIELARAVRTSRPSIPILIVTGFVHPDLELHARELGTCEVLAKPVSRVELIDAVGRLLGLAEAHQDAIQRSE
jgi:PAS domain S-box-containing protein